MANRKHIKVLPHYATLLNLLCEIYEQERDLISPQTCVKLEEILHQADMLSTVGGAKDFDRVREKV
jgi:hypothetical protein